jgi:HEAT repeat protein
VPQEAQEAQVTGGAPEEAATAAEHGETVDDVFAWLGLDGKVEPQLEARIQELASELERERSQNRVRAERHLRSIGKPAIPYLVPLTKSPGDLTRIAVMKLFYSFGDERVVESCIEALFDRNEYVRDYAAKTLRRITGQNFGYSPSASPRHRAAVKKKWSSWWESELERIRKEIQAAGDGATGNS